MRPNEQRSKTLIFLNKAPTNHCDLLPGSDVTIETFLQVSPIVTLPIIWRGKWSASAWRGIEQA